MLYRNNLQAKMVMAGGPIEGEFLTREEASASVLELGRTSYYRIHRLMTVMEQPTPEKPGWPSEEMFRLRVRLDLEEFFEKLVLGYYEGNPVEIIDGACDVEVVGTGSSIAFGVDHELCIAEVDRSNLSKLGLDGKPIKDEYGKFQKGPKYTKPNLKQFLGDLLDTPAPYDTKLIVKQEFLNVLFGEKNRERNAGLLEVIGAAFLGGS